MNFEKLVSCCGMTILQNTGRMACKSQDGITKSKHRLVTLVIASLRKS